MQVNGYQLKEAVRRWKTRTDIANKQFHEALYAFEGETKSDPATLGDAFTTAWANYAKAQETQQIFNAQIQVQVQDQRITLQLAVKLIAGAGIAEKMWRTAATDTGRDKYSYREMTRTTDTIVAQRQITQTHAMQRADQAARYAAALRAAIATGNALTIDLEITPEIIE